jgi:hypothetical protein
MNRVITEAGNLADLAILLIGRPSLAIAFRRASEGAVMQTIEAFLHSQWHVASGHDQTTAYPVISANDFPLL